MGVTGLLPNLKDIQEKSSLEKYRGKTLAIDTYGWLHRGLISCAQELCQDQPTRRYITSIMKKVDMLRHFGVEPYFVFDGAALPTKADTANDRRLKRQEARKKADAYVKNNQKLLAWKEYMKAASVTSQMAKSLMVELDKFKIKYVVAPYEADPQMVYLEKMGLADGILSEDSDLLIFGCNRLITKLKDDGSCVEICRENFDKVKQIPYLSKYTPEQLRLVAMLSGCDYTKGIAGIGLKSAFTLVKKFNNLEKVLIALRSDGKTIPADFEDEVNKANLAFQFQKVFDPKILELTTLNEYPEGIQLDFEVLESCCGRTYNNDIYRNLCMGKINPNTHEILVSREQSLGELKSESVNYGNSNTSNVPKRSHSENVTTTNKSILDLLKVSKTKFSTVCSPVSPVRNVKRFKLEDKKVSPTSKKVKNISQADSSKSFSTPGQVSKFFTTNITPPFVTVGLPTPKSNKTDFNSSMLSGESDFTDEFSSPVNHIRASQTQSQPIPKITTMEVLTDDDQQFSGLSDDCDKDDYENERQVFDSVRETIEDSVPISVKSFNESKLDLGLQKIEFDDEEYEDEIEESPIKPEETQKEKLSAFRSALRESFLFNSNVAPTISKFMIRKQESRVARVAVSESNGKVSVSNDKFSDSTLASSSPPRESVLTPKNLNLDVKFQKDIPTTIQEDSYEISEDDSQSSPIKPSQSFNLKRFAFRG